MLLLVILAMDYCTIQALSITRDPDTNSQPTIIPSLTHSQSTTQPLSTHNGKGSISYALNLDQVWSSLTAFVSVPLPQLGEHNSECRQIEQNLVYI